MIETTLFYIRFRCRIDGVVTDKMVAGPYSSEEQARDDIQRVLNEAMEVDCWAVFYHFYVDPVVCRAKPAKGEEENSWNA